jgi:hypothetical protein
MVWQLNFGGKGEPARHQIDFNYDMRALCVRRSEE